MNFEKPTIESETRGKKGIELAENAEQFAAKEESAIERVRARARAEKLKRVFGLATLLAGMLAGASSAEAGWGRRLKRDLGWRIQQAVEETTRSSMEEGADRLATAIEKMKLHKLLAEAELAQDKTIWELCALDPQWMERWALDMEMDIRTYYNLIQEGQIKEDAGWETFASQKGIPFSADSRNPEELKRREQKHIEVLDRIKANRREAGSSLKSRYATEEGKQALEERKRQQEEMLSAIRQQIERIEEKLEQTEYEKVRRSAQRIRRMAWYF